MSLASITTAKGQSLSDAKAGLIDRSARLRVARSMSPKAPPRVTAPSEVFDPTKREVGRHRGLATTWASDGASGQSFARFPSSRAVS